MNTNLSFFNQLAVCQKNLSSVHEIWTDFVKNYSPSVSSLRKFIWSYARMGDVKSAYTALQKMVTLANGAAGRKLQSLDIPIPSRTELYRYNFNFEEKEPSIDEFFYKKMVPWNGDVRRISVSGIKCGEVETGPLTVPNNHKSSFVRKVLIWSSNDVMRACSLAGNCGLAEQLMQQVLFLSFEIIFIQ